MCPDVLFIPAGAHLDPHFAALGSKSGFDSLEECYEDLQPYIYVVETGLSSDPAVHSRPRALDRFTLVSNSDAHSPPKLGREATCFDTQPSYPAILEVLRQRHTSRFTSMMEFYPEEGKYHHDGHRKCGICWEPAQTIAAQGVCPECGRQLTVGVLHRIETLADRPTVEAITTPPRRLEHLIPLPEVISAVVVVGPGSKRVQTTYHILLAELGPELHILRELDPGQIESRGGEPLVAEGVQRMRAGKVCIDPGYDGEYGRVHLFCDAELAKQ